MPHLKLLEELQELRRARLALAGHRAQAGSLFESLQEGGLLQPRHLAASFTNILEEEHLAFLFNEFGFDPQQGLTLAQFEEAFFGEQDPVDNDYEPGKLFREVVIREWTVSHRIRKETLDWEDLPSELAGIVARKKKASNPDILVESHLKLEESEPDSQPQPKPKQSQAQPPQTPIPI
jgi:hypothetical protein